MRLLFVWFCEMELIWIQSNNYFISFIELTICSELLSNTGFKSSKGLNQNVSSKKKYIKHILIHSWICIERIVWHDQVPVIRRYNCYWDCTTSHSSTLSGFGGIHNLPMNGSEYLAGWEWFLASSATTFPGGLIVILFVFQFMQLDRTDIWLLTDCCFGYWDWELWVMRSTRGTLCSSSLLGILISSSNRE